MLNMLFADSGGTSTDWVYLDLNGNKIYFETESYHPSNWNSEFWSRLEKFWASKKHLLSYTLNFYGTGCLNPENAKLINEKFKSFGFEYVEVKSDLHAAGFASYKSGVGVVVISGTGSVRFDYSNEEVLNVTGGKGHIIGDEGSGFYFGKLVLEKFIDGSLSETQVAKLNEVSNPHHLANLNIHDAKFQWAELSKLVAKYPSDFREIHLENINQFIDKHFTKKSGLTISLIGSYAFYHQEHWQSELDRVNIKVDQFVHKPIESFID